MPTNSDPVTTTVLTHASMRDITYQPQRRLGYLLLFALLLGASLLYQQSQPAHADALMAGATVPNGTIPPGGTVPPAPVAPSQGQVRVLHLAPIGPTDMSTVDLCTEAGVPVPGLTGLTYLSQSGYLTLEPGLYDWKVSTPDCGMILLDLPAFRVGPGTVLTLLLVGDNVNQPLTSLVLVDAAGRPYLQHLPLVFAPTE